MCTLYVLHDIWNEDGFWLSWLAAQPVFASGSGEGIIQLGTQLIDFLENTSNKGLLRLRNIMCNKNPLGFTTFKPGEYLTTNRNIIYDSVQYYINNIIKSATVRVYMK